MDSIYEIVGLSLNFVGAWCLAYELLWGYPNKNRKVTAESRLANIDQYFEQMDRIIDGWSEPPYTAEEKRDEKKKTRATMESHVEKLKATIDKYDQSHKEKSFFIGLVGAILLSLGFVLQLIALL